MKKYLILVLIMFLLVSCVEEVKLDTDEMGKAKAETPCFQVENDVCGSNIIPMPSDFMYQAMPNGAELGLASDTPFTLAFSYDIDATSLENHVMVFKDRVPYTAFTAMVHPESKNVLLLVPNEHWEAGSYSVLLLKGIKNKEGHPFVESIAFYYAKEKLPLLKEDGEPRYSVLDKEKATSLEALRKAYEMPLKGLELALNKERKEFLMLWNVTIKDQFVACFLSTDIEGCEQFKEVPVPSDFLMKDNHLNFPIAEDDNPMVKAMLTEVNKMDGWGVVSPFMVHFSQNIKPESIQTDLSDMTKTSVFVFKVGQAGATPVPIEANWHAATRTLSIVPANGKVWEEQSFYSVVVTDLLKNEANNALIKSPALSLVASTTPLADQGKSLYPSALSDEKAVGLEQVRQKMDPLFAGLERVNLTRSRVSMVFTVTTQTVTKDLRDLALMMNSQDNPMPLNVINTGEVSQAIIPTLISGFLGGDLATYLQTYGYTEAEELYSHIAYVHTGTFQSPNFMSTETGAWDPAKFVNGPTAEVIPFVMGFPMKNSGSETEYCDMPENGFPVIIFQHGLGKSKEDVVSVANRFAKECYITIAIDAVKHGERKIDGDTTGFFSPNLFASRDNIRQSVLDLIQLKKAIDYMGSPAYMQLPADYKLDATQTTYFGMSLGGIIGTLFLAVAPDVHSAVLNVPGGGLTNILNMTQAGFIKTPILEALAAMGINEGTPAYAEFMFIAQLILDKADPLGYANAILTAPLHTTAFTYAPKKVLVQKSVNDEVIPNSTTDHLAQAIGVFNESDSIENDYFKVYSPSTNSKHSFIFYNEDQSNLALSDAFAFYNEVLLGGDNE